MGTPLSHLLDHSEICGYIPNILYPRNIFVVVVVDHHRSETTLIATSHSHFIQVIQTRVSKKNFVLSFLFFVLVHAILLEGIIDLITTI
jgi:hypothetical protein